MTDRAFASDLQEANAQPGGGLCYLPVVETALSTQGEVLDSDTRSIMEGRFGRDFSKVRIHTDAQAASAASALQAHALTLGEHVLFANGAYRPTDRWGRSLLMHELTHVVQQAAPAAPNSGGTGTELEASAQEMAGSGKVPTMPRVGTPMIQRAGFFESIARFFGGGTFSNEELVAYLGTLRRTQQIENNYDSDNKARDVVRRARNGETQFSGLTESIRVLLIKEMLSGYVSGDDEGAILDLLNEAPPPEALRMVAAVGETELRLAFSGANLRRLVALIDGAQVAPSSAGRWSGQRITAIFRHEGRERVLANLANAGWSVWSFETAFDTWEYPDGRTVEEEVTGLRGNTDRGQRRIRLSERMSDEEAASTLLHESVHALGGPPTSNQPAVAQQQHLQQEVDARVVAEQYHIARGLPPSEPGYRNPDGSVNVAFIHNEIFNSPHYNPTTRERVGARRWVGDRPVSGVLPRVAP